MCISALPLELAQQGLINVTQHCIEDPSLSSGWHKVAMRAQGRCLAGVLTSTSAARRPGNFRYGICSGSGSGAVRSTSYRVESAMLIAGGGSSGVVDWKSGKLSVWGQVAT